MSIFLSLSHDRTEIYPPVTKPILCIILCKKVHSRQSHDSRKGMKLTETAGHQYSKYSYLLSHDLTAKLSATLCYNWQVPNHKIPYLHKNRSVLSKQAQERKPQTEYSCKVTTEITRSNVKY